MSELFLSPFFSRNTLPKNEQRRDHKKMNRFKLSNFNPALQVQLFLTTAFRLQKTLTLNPLALSELVKSGSDTPPWEENLGLLQQLKFQSEHLSESPRLDDLKNAINSAILECKSGHLNKSQILFNLTAEFLFASEPNENLYYFLLRHQEECKTTFGRVFLLNFFKKKHRNLKQTEQFLIDKYQERGFLHLKPSIRNYLAGLTRC